MGTSAKEREILEKMGVRWAVLTAWVLDLGTRGAKCPPLVQQRLDQAYAKLSSGCFSSCEIGCTLNEVEATLTSVDASRADSCIDYWTDMLGKAMAEGPPAREMLNIPAVQVYDSDCHVGGCNCKG